MLVISQAMVVVGTPGQVRVEGLLAPHRAKIGNFLADLGLENVRIRYRFGRFLFSGNVDESLRQRLRNFLVNECPMKK